MFVTSEQRGWLIRAKSQALLFGLIGALVRALRINGRSSAFDDTACRDRRSLLRDESPSARPCAVDSVQVERRRLRPLPAGRTASEGGDGAVGTAKATVGNAGRAGCVAVTVAARMANGSVRKSSRCVLRSMAFSALVATVAAVAAGTEQAQVRRRHHKRFFFASPRPPCFFCLPVRHDSRPQPTIRPSFPMNHNIDFGFNVFGVSRSR